MVKTVRELLAAYKPQGKEEYLSAVAVGGTSFKQYIKFITNLGELRYWYKTNTVYHVDDQDAPLALGRPTKSRSGKGLRAANFRLTPEALKTIDHVHKKGHISKNDVVELGVQLVGAYGVSGARKLLKQANKATSA